MLTSLARFLSGAVRLIVIVAMSVVAGVAVALASRNMQGDVLQLLALFATFALPISVAWLLFRLMSPVFSRSTGLRHECVLENRKTSQGANGQQRHGPASPGQRQ
jgi:hypothetical protein